MRREGQLNQEEERPLQTEQEIFQKKDEEEKGEKNKISMEFFFSAHGTAEDAKGIKKKIDECDIFVPELFGWDDFNIDKKVLQAIAAGKIKPDKVPYKSKFTQAVAEALYNTKKTIIVLDVEEKHPRFKEIEENSSKRKVFLAAEMAAFLDGDFEKAIEYNKKSSDCYEKGMAIREGILVEKIKSFKEDLEKNKDIEKYMQASGKQNLKVLMQLGSAHTGVYQTLKKDMSEDVKRSLGNETIVHTPEEEIRRRKLLGKEVSKDILSRSVLQHLLVVCYRKVTDDNNKAEWVAREVAKQFSVTEIKELCSKLGREESEDKKITVMGDFFLSHGATLPESEKDIDKILKRYTGKNSDQ